MEGLFSFLLFAAFFYFMMRFGCGAHAIHGGHHGDAKGGTPDVDPVCGKLLKDDEGYGKMHQGKLYRFCSQKCLQTFEGNPARYMLNAPDDKGGRNE